MFSPPRQITDKDKRHYIRRKMRKERMKCLWSVIRHGLKKSWKTSHSSFLFVWFDMMACAVRYTMPVGRYQAERFFFLDKPLRKILGESLVSENKEKFARWSIRWNWYREYALIGTFKSSTQPNGGTNLYLVGNGA